MSFRPTGPPIPKPSKPKPRKAPHPSSPGKWDYSIKPMAYVFPQFHPIIENDIFWGENFTEWTNVNKTTYNNFGQEIIRPSEEVGYYNLLDLETRVRFRKFAKEIGLYGFVYHHYWFGSPVMDKVLLKLLEKDGEPNTPFMLSWANEPWSGQWDRENHDDVLMNQNYGGMSEWREHFNWLLPFFKYPNYIRNNGRLQFLIYNPLHAGYVGKRMADAFRKWAWEEGVGPLDITEAKMENDRREDRGVADGMYEFGLRSGGGKDMAAWTNIRRTHPIYHRGVAVSWDNTPREAMDGKGTVSFFTHCKLWQNVIQEKLRQIKLDPNRRGEENFFFINAFNEWGEGNVLEPSKQWGDCFGRALSSALEHAKTVPWKDEIISAGEKMAVEIDEDHMDQVDVCVIVRATDSTKQFSYADPVSLSEMLDSLKKQQNKRWRAVVIPTHTHLNGQHPSLIKDHVIAAHDARLRYFSPPLPIRKMESPTSGGWMAVDWMILNMERLASDCARASRLLVTDFDMTYSPETFNLVARETGDSIHLPDIMGLNYETLLNIMMTEDSSMPWDARCARIADGSADTCIPAAGDLPDAALCPGALFLDFKKFRRGRHRFVGLGLELLWDLVEVDGWSWETTQNSACHMRHARTPTHCNRVGKFWIDVPEVANGKGYEYWSGCYSLSTFVGKYGNSLNGWDMDSWKKEPWCLRLQEGKYNEVIRWDLIFGEMLEVNFDKESKKKGDGDDGDTSDAVSEKLLNSAEEPDSQENDGTPPGERSDRPR
ncbi:hypothetical protein MKZ38_002064 [Zalerion maritima]|uniref:Uncharacterized protein n=1 Tax=Zalerion maritima TaxID=339359 RepID=A0AAD5WWW8_9PEZI|nr:hypothetical protein MKZ38_002064 [Zalerion maritima]